MEKKVIHRVRRHVYDQFVTLEYAIERMIANKGCNKDFGKLPEDLQKGFLQLAPFLDVLRRKYSNWLWDEACKIEKKKGEKAAETFLPDNLKVKLQAVQTYVKELEEVDTAA